MYRYLTIILFSLGHFCFAQGNVKPYSVSEDSLTGDNLIISWTLGEVVAGYAGFDKNVDEDISCHAKFTISSIEKTNAAQLLKIHPNSGSDFVILHLKQVQSEEIILQDISGNILIQKDIPKSTKSYELNLSSYEDGVYFLTINTDESIALEKFRLIKNSAM